MRAELAPSEPLPPAGSRLTGMHGTPVLPPPGGS